MKPIKHIFNNIVVLGLLLVLGIGLILFLSSRSQNSDLTSQAQATKKPASPQNEKKPTITSTPTIEPTIPNETEPEDDQPEPTWTPAIIEPEGTPPPLPSPPPTPTPTPINPKEKTIVTFDVLVSGLAISPDDKTLAMVANIPTSEGSRLRRIWLLDLTSNQTEKLEISGQTPTWSPNGQYISFWVRQDNQVEVKVMNSDGQEEKNLISSPWDNFLGHYWVASEQIDVIRTDGIKRVDLTGRVADQANITLPAKVRNADIKPQVVGHPDGVVIVADGQDLQIIRHNGQTATIRDPEGGQRRIVRFSLAPNGQQLAYVVNDGATNNELWITNLAEANLRKLYRVERGHMRSLTWTPDSKTIVVGWRETGTYLGEELTLLWLDVNNGQATPLQVDGVDSGSVFSHDGNRLFYGRTSFPQPSDEGQTTLYQLEVSR